MQNRFLLIVIAIGATIDMASSARGNEVVHVELQDPSSGPPSHGMAVFMDKSRVKTGPITFEASNASKDLVHELILAPEPVGEIPYDARRDRVVEKGLHALGEIPNLKPGQHGKLTRTLKPGRYVLLCNEPGHFHSGMIATLTVER